MSMFDTLNCRRRLPDGLDGSTTSFQTKDLECLLFEYEVTDAGILMLRAWEFEGPVPPEERPHPPGHPLHEILGAMRSRWLAPVPVAHHGDIIFYGLVEDNWHEYRARFTHGRLESIVDHADRHPRPRDPAIAWRPGHPVQRGDGVFAVQPAQG